MQQGKFSRTAHRVAIRRAAHQLLDQPRVHDDPLALAVIGAEAARALQQELHKQQDARARALRAFLAARGRYAEDQLKLALANGVSQYVVLGAGLDTFAFRNPHPELRIFEVDHPATQSWKLERLRDAGISIPDSVAFVSVDLEQQSLSAALALEGFSLADSTFFSWLGVTPYIKREACMSTLGFIARMPKRSGVVFDFAVHPDLLDAGHRMILTALSERVAAAGEPFQLFFHPEELARDLQTCGFCEIEMLAGDQINARYFKDRTDGLQISGNLGRLTCAWV
jgi:methyltransferase (TIGR00027 family)